MLSTLKCVLLCVSLVTEHTQLQEYTLINLGGGVKVVYFISV